MSKVIINDPDDFHEMVMVTLFNHLIAVDSGYLKCSEKTKNSMLADLKKYSPTKYKLYLDMRDGKL